MQLPDQADFPIIQEILQEKDRGAAVVAGGFLEAKLSQLIRAALRDDKDTARQLLKPTGPLGSYGTKVLLGYMLRLYRKETRDDLTLIGEIRNRFAHRPEPLTFGNPWVVERTEKLTLYSRVWSVIPNFEFPKPPYDQASSRKMYVETVSLAANFFHHQTAHKEFRDRAEELLPS